MGKEPAENKKKILSKCHSIEVRLKKKRKRSKFFKVSSKTSKQNNPLPLTPVWKLEERLDLDMVHMCLDPAKGLPLVHRDRVVLNKILEYTNKQTGVLKDVKYYHSKHRQSGRVYASISLQRLSSKVRNLCIPNDGKSIDVDIANAHPEILYQVFKKHGIHAPVLQNYIQDRDELIAEILEHFPELSRKDVKKAFITAQNQGCYKKQATGGQEIEFLDEFTAELKRAASELYKLDTYSDTRKYVETANGDRNKSKNLLGSFIFHVCEDVEIQLVTAARDTLQQSGFAVRVNMYDGLIVEPSLDHKQEQPTRLDLDKLNEAVTQATGYVVRFVIKPIVRNTMEEIRADCMLLLPVTYEQQQQRQRQQQVRPLLGLSYPHCQLVEIGGVKMAEDPKMKQCGKSSKYSFVKGPQGVGKSYAMMQLAVDTTLVDGECIVFVTPSITLAQQTQADLKKFLAARGDTRRVLLYNEGDARSAPVDEWEFLVVGPLSTHHFVEILVERKVRTLYLDELPEIQSMLTYFPEAERTNKHNLSIARAVLSVMVTMATNVVAISAQLEDRNIQWVLDLKPNLTKQKQQQQTMVVYQSTHVPPPTKVMKLASVKHALRILQNLILDGMRVVCFTETVVMAERLKEWLDTEHKGAIVSIAFTKDINDAAGGVPGKDITAHLEGTGYRFFVHTTALGVGMNLSNEFDVRMVIADKGFVPMKKAAQEMGRARNLKGPSVVFIYVKDDKTAPTKGLAREKEAQELMAMKHPDSVTPACSLHDGSITFEPIDNVETDYKIDLARESVNERSADDKWDALARSMDNPSMFENAPGYYDHDDEEIVGWEEAGKRVKGHHLQDWKKTAYHFLHSEVIGMCKKAVRARGQINDASFMTLDIHTTQSAIMPHMVRTCSQIGGHSLTHEFLYDVYKNYYQLDNLLNCVATVQHANRNDTTAKPVFLCSRKYATEMNIRLLTSAVLEACAGHVKLQLSVVGTEQDQDVFALATVTPIQTKKACEWLDEYWIDVRAFMLENGSRRQPNNMPFFNSDNWWVFVKSFLRVCFGFGLRTVPVNKKTNGTGIRTIVANSFYAKHNVDVLAVIANHRQQTYKPPLEPPTATHNGRKFGQYPAMMRNCDMCLPGGPPVLCVRQFGTQWRCMYSSAPGVKPHTPRHRDFHNQIDMGYLDVEPPPSNSKSLMTLQELCEHDSVANTNTMLIDDRKEEENEPEQRQQQEIEEDRTRVDENWARLPTHYRQLLVHLGFAFGVYKVTGQEMQEAWETATEVGYLDLLQLPYCANNSAKLKTVRVQVLQLVHDYNLNLETKRVWTHGKNVNVYILSSY
jgi:uncharacterized protein (DUF433 family)